MCSDRDHLAAFGKLYGHRAPPSQYSPGPHLTRRKRHSPREIPTISQVCSNCLASQPSRRTTSIHMAGKGKSTSPRENQDKGDTTALAPCPAVSPPAFSECHLECPLTMVRHPGSPQSSFSRSPPPQTHTPPASPSQQAKTQDLLGRSSCSGSTHQSGHERSVANDPRLRHSAGSPNTPVTDVLCVIFLGLP